MASESDVIKEFLVSLGFQVDQTALKKFNTAIGAITKTVLKLGVAVAASVAGVVAGVKVISSEMERLYYASQRTGETVGNLMALRYAAGQIGLTAEQAQGALEGFTRSIRLNPGLGGLLHQMGVGGRNPTEVFENFIGRLRQMRPYIAAQYAALFGIDPDTLLMLEQGLPKLAAEQQRYRDKLRAFGIKPEQAAQAGTRFDNSIRDLMADIHLFWVLLQEHLAPVLDIIVKKFEKWEAGHADKTAQKIATALETVANWVAEIDWDKVGKHIDAFLDKAEKVAQVIGKIVGGVSKVADWFGGSDANAKSAGAPASDSPSGFTDWVKEKVDRLNNFMDLDNHVELFANLEKKTGLPPGTLDKLWDMESGRGRYMLSPAGAKGHFQFMDATAKMYGVSNPNDLAQSATGAAKYLRDLMTRYGGDLHKALAAYNWGPGNLDKDIAQHGNSWMSFLPKETAGYLGKFDGMKLGAKGAMGGGRSATIQQKTDIHVYGSADPGATGRAVASEQGRVNGDIIRNMAGVMA